MIAACTIVFIFAFIVSGKSERPDYWPNVGSVLFTRKDVHRRTMEKTRIAVLQARRYFQTLVPPPDLGVPEDYVQQILSYFRHAYICIKKEAPDPEIDKIMTTALSDAVGGYIKRYMLPFTKVYFYGGILSFEDAARVLSFYEEVKKYLNTDGAGWLKPDQSVLNSISINAPRRARDKPNPAPKCVKDPCNNFAYLEKTKTGLELPMPKINWEDNTMFVPFKNETTFSLESPKYADSLNKYFNNAKCCVHAMGPKTEDKFDDKFQTWLTGEVVPHLSDDHLYVALANVLNLVNKTKAMCDSIVEIYQEGAKKRDSCFLHNLFSSKTVCVVTAVLLLELIWCACAFRHLFLKKYKRKDVGFMSTVEQGQRTITSTRKLSRDDVCCTPNCAEVQSCDTSKGLNHKSNYIYAKRDGLKLQQKPRSTVSEFGGQCPSRLTVVKETLGVGTSDFIMKTESMSNILRESGNTSVTSKIEYVPCTPSMGCVPCTPSKTETITLSPPAASTETKSNIYCKSKEIIGCVPIEYRHNQTTETKAFFKRSHTNIDGTITHTREKIKLKKEGLKLQVLSTSPKTFEVSTPMEAAGGLCSDGICACVKCLQDQDNESAPRKQPSCRGCLCEQVQMVSDKKEPIETQAVIVRADADEKTETKHQKQLKSKTIIMQKEIYVSRNSEHKRTRKPAYLQIEIEKPKHTEIQLGVTGIKGKIEKKEFVVSKIPKKSATDQKPEYNRPALPELPRVEQTTETTQETKDAVISGTAMDEQVDVGTDVTINNPTNHSSQSSSSKNLTESRHKTETNPDPPKDKPLGIRKYYKKRTKDKKPTIGTSMQPNVFIIQSSGSALNTLKKEEKPGCSEKSPTLSPSLKKKSMIPKLKRPLAADDATIKSKMADEDASRRLNVSL